MPKLKPECEDPRRSGECYACEVAGQFEMYLDTITS